jgi:hypothetical protein
MVGKKTLSFFFRLHLELDKKNLVRRSINCNSLYKYNVSVLVHSLYSQRVSQESGKLQRWETLGILPAILLQAYRIHNLVVRVSQKLNKATSTMRVFILEMPV